MLRHASAAITSERRRIKDRDRHHKTFQVIADIFIFQGDNQLTSIDPRIQARRRSSKASTRLLDVQVIFLHVHMKLTGLGDPITQHGPNGSHLTTTHIHGVRAIS